MGSKIKRKNQNRPSGKRLRLTMAGLIGLALGVLLVGLGLTQAIAHGEYAGYFVMFLGLFCVAAVGWGSIRRGSPRSNR